MPSPKKLCVIGGEGEDTRFPFSPKNTKNVKLQSQGVERPAIPNPKKYNPGAIFSSREIYLE